jgi:hypothetical protein
LLISSADARQPADADSVCSGSGCLSALPLSVLRHHVHHGLLGLVSLSVADALGDREPLNQKDREMVDQNSASWSRVGEWLGRLAALRRVT